ncbi:MAG: hypothetical protein IKS51_08745 [Erysipelotrichaceae bacterium]|nr:hypothetical protein [Erysipelotrichaceae bacterium]
MDIKTLSGSALSYLGDAIFTLKVREFYLEHNYRTPGSLQQMTARYNSAAGQRKAYERMDREGFFTADELEVFKRGRNDISHIPASSDLVTYEIASGLEAICGYLYLMDQDRMNEVFDEIFKGGIENE